MAAPQRPAPLSPTGQQLLEQVRREPDQTSFLSPLAQGFMAPDVSRPGAVGDPFVERMTSPAVPGLMPVSVRTSDPLPPPGTSAMALAFWRDRAATPEEKVRRRQAIEEAFPDDQGETAWTNLTYEEALLAPITGDPAIDRSLKRDAAALDSHLFEGLKDILPMQTAGYNQFLGDQDPRGARRAAAILQTISHGSGKRVIRGVEHIKSARDVLSFMGYGVGMTAASLASTIMGRAAGAVAGAAAGGPPGALAGAVAGGALSQLPMSLEETSADAAARQGYREESRGAIGAGATGAALLEGLLPGVGGRAIGGVRGLGRALTGGPGRRIASTVGGEAVTEGAGEMARQATAAGATGDTLGREDVLEATNEALMAAMTAGMFSGTSEGSQAVARGQWADEAPLDEAPRAGPEVAPAEPQVAEPEPAQPRPADQHPAVAKGREALDLQVREGFEQHGARDRAGAQRILDRMNPTPEQRAGMEPVLDRIWGPLEGPAAEAPAEAEIPAEPAEAEAPAEAVAPQRANLRMVRAALDRGLALRRDIQTRAVERSEYGVWIPKAGAEPFRLPAGTRVRSIERAKNGAWIITPEREDGQPVDPVVVSRSADKADITAAAQAALEPAPEPAPEAAPEPEPEAAPAEPQAAAEPEIPPAPAEAAPAEAAPEAAPEPEPEAVPAAPESHFDVPDIQAVIERDGGIDVRRPNHESLRITSISPEIEKGGTWLAKGTMGGRPTTRHMTDKAVKALAKVARAQKPSKPAPVSTEPAPVSTEPAPEPAKPAPVSTKPAPEPAETKPASSETKAASAETKPAEAAERLPAEPPGVSADDISREAATAAHMGTSWSPDERADQERQGYVDHMKRVWDTLAQRVEKRGNDSAMMQEARDQFERYRERYASRYGALLGRRSRMISPMIAGPSKFPTRRAEKANNAYEDALGKFLEWDKKARRRMTEAVNPTAAHAISSDRADAVEALQQKIDKAKKNQETWKAINRIVRRRIPDDQKVKEIQEQLGFSEATARNLLEPDFAGRRGIPSYQTKNNLANIRRMEARVAEIGRTRARPPGRAEFDGGSIEENADANRVQVMFDEKPGVEMRNWLKGSGFRWAPSQGAWQRKRTDAAIQEVERKFGVKLEAPAEEAADDELAPPTPAEPDTEADRPEGVEAPKPDPPDFGRKIVATVDTSSRLFRVMDALMWAVVDAGHGGDTFRAAVEPIRTVARSGPAPPVGSWRQTVKNLRNEVKRRGDRMGREELAAFEAGAYANTAVSDVIDASGTREARTLAPARQSSIETANQVAELLGGKARVLEIAQRAAQPSAEPKPAPRRKATRKKDARAAQPKPQPATAEGPLTLNELAGLFRRGSAFKLRTNMLGNPQLAVEIEVGQGGRVRVVSTDEANLLIAERGPESAEPSADRRAASEMFAVPKPEGLASWLRAETRGDAEVRFRRENQYTWVASAVDPAGNTLSEHTHDRADGSLPNYDELLDRLDQEAPRAVAHVQVKPFLEAVRAAKSFARGDWGDVRLTLDPQADELVLSEEVPKIDGKRQPRRAVVPGVRFDQPFPVAPVSWIARQDSLAKMLTAMPSAELELALSADLAKPYQMRATGPDGTRYRGVAMPLDPERAGGGLTNRGAEREALPSGWTVRFEGGQLRAVRGGDQPADTGPRARFAEAVYAAWQIEDGPADTAGQKTEKALPVKRLLDFIKRGSAARPRGHDTYIGTAGVELELGDDGRVRVTSSDHSFLVYVEEGPESTDPEAKRREQADIIVNVHEPDFQKWLRSLPAEAEIVFVEKSGNWEAEVVGNPAARHALPRQVDTLAHYEHVLPKEAKVRAQVPRKELADAVKRLLALPEVKRQAYRRVGVTITGPEGGNPGSLTLKTTGEYREERPPHYQRPTPEQAAQKPERIEVTAPTTITLPLLAHSETQPEKKPGEGEAVTGTWFVNINHFHQILGAMERGVRTVELRMQGEGEGYEIAPVESVASRFRAVAMPLVGVALFGAFTALHYLSPELAAQLAPLGAFAAAAGIAPGGIDLRGLLGQVREGARAAREASDEGAQRVREARTAPEAVGTAIRENVSADVILTNPAVQQELRALMDRVVATGPPAGVPPGGVPPGRGPEIEGPAPEEAPPDTGDNHLRHVLGPWLLNPRRIFRNDPYMRHMPDEARRAANEGHAAQANLRLALDRTVEPRVNRLSEGDRAVASELIFGIYDARGFWPTADRALRDATERQADDPKGVADLVMAAFRFTRETAAPVIRRHERYMQALAERQLEGVIAQVTSDDQQAAILRRWAGNIQHRRVERAKARAAHHRAQQGRAEPEPFFYQEPPSSKHETKTESAARTLFQRFGAPDFRAALLAEFVARARESADVDATMFREGYFPHIFYGNFAVIRMVGDPDGNVTANRLAVPWGQSGFDTLEEAREAAHADWLAAQDAGAAEPRYRITSPKFRAQTWRRLTPGESRRTQAALRALAQTVSGRAAQEAIDLLGVGIDLDRKTLEQIGKVATKGWTPAILDRYLSAEAEKRTLSALRARKGTEGYGTDILRVLQDHADSVGNHIRTDRIFSMSTRILHREGTIFHHEGRYTDRQHPKDDTAKQRAFREWTWDVLFVQQRMNRFLNNEYFVRRLLRSPLRPGSAADIIAKATLLYTFTHFLDAWNRGKGMWAPIHLLGGALYGLTVGSVAAARTGPDVAENVSAEDVRLQVWFKLGMQPFYLTYALMNATQTFVTVPSKLGWRAWAGGTAEWVAYVTKQMPDAQRNEINAALERAGVLSAADRAFFDALGGPQQGGNERLAKLVKFMGLPGLLVERHNRIFTYVAARRLALQGTRRTTAQLEAQAERQRAAGRLSDSRRTLLATSDPARSADAFAEQMVSETQFDTSPANRPGLLRMTSPVIRDAFLFKSFQWQMAGVMWNSLLGSDKQLGEQVRNPEGRRTLANRLGAFAAVQIPLVLLAGRIAAPIGMAQFAYEWLRSLLDDDEDEEVPPLAVSERARRVGLRTIAGAVERAEEYAGNPQKTFADHAYMAWTWALPALIGLSSSRSVGYREWMPIPGGARLDRPGQFAEGLFVSGPGRSSVQRAVDRMERELDVGGALGSMSPGLGRIIHSFAEDTRTATGLLVSEDEPTLLDFLRQFVGLPSMREAIRQEQRLLEALARSDKARFSAEIRSELARRLRAGERYDDLERRWWRYGRGPSDLTVRFRKSFRQVVNEERAALEAR